MNYKEIDKLRGGDNVSWYGNIFFTFSHKDINFFWFYDEYGMRKFEACDMAGPEMVLLARDKSVWGVEQDESERA